MEHLHSVSELVRAPGELSFQAQIGDTEQSVWFRSETPVTPPADGALASCLMPAMRRGGGCLTMPGRISPRLLRTQREYQAIQAAWSLDWEFGDPPLEEVEVVAPSRAPDWSSPATRVAAFFSGGVDSWATVLANPDLTDLIFVRGVDILPGAAHQAGLAAEVEARLRAAAGELGLPLHVVETNVRELSDPIVRWENYSPCPLLAIALFFEPLFGRVLIATDTDHRTQQPSASGRLVDQLWSTERLEIVDDGGRLNREQRVHSIAAHPIAQQTLRVCWENPDGAYNCGRCRKCVLTMISLEAIGVRERFSTFPPDLDLGLVAGFEVHQSIGLALWEDTLDTARAAGRADLERALEPLVAKGKRNLGLPPAHSGRRSHRPPPTPGSPHLDARAAPGSDAAVLEEILSSRSWRITAPMRRLGARLRRLSARFRRR
jgi:hypothetical protein